MKAAVINSNNQVSIENVPDPAINSDEVLVDVKYCGICASDINPFYESQYNPGTIMGHELAGEIVEVGNDITDWKVGQRVVSMAYGACQSCYWCHKGEPNMCINKYWIGLGFNPGAFAELCKVKSNMLYAIPDNVSYKDAAITEPLSVALHAIRLAHPNIGEKATILGVGSVGMLLAQALRIIGVFDIVVIDKIEKRLKTAKSLGISAALTLDEADPDRVKALIGDFPELVFDCAGAPSSVQYGADLIKRHGRLILVGLSSAPVTLNAKEWSRKELSLQVSMAYTDEFQLALELLGNNKINVSSVVSHVIDLAELPNVIDTLRTNDEYMKVLIRM